MKSPFASARCPRPYARHASNDFVLPSPPSAEDGRLESFNKSRTAPLSAELSAEARIAIVLRETPDETSNSSTRTCDGSLAPIWPQMKLPAPTRFASSAAARVDLGVSPAAASATS